jgi:hypothetical protein
LKRFYVSPHFNWTDCSTLKVCPNLFEVAKVLVSLGAIGFGLVWGWLLGLYDVRPEKMPAAIASLSGASVAGAGVTAWLGGLSATAPFSVAALVALWAHTQWRSQLRKRYGHSNNNLK